MGGDKGQLSRREKEEREGETARQRDTLELKRRRIAAMGGRWRRKRIRKEKIVKEMQME